MVEIVYSVFFKTKLEKKATWRWELEYGSEK